MPVTLAVEVIRTQRGTLFVRVPDDHPVYLDLTDRVQHGIYLDESIIEAAMIQQGGQVDWVDDEIDQEGIEVIHGSGAATRRAYEVVEES